MKNFQIALCAVAALAVPRATAQTEPVFRTTSEVVLVPASVLDKHGQPVAGLKREDFELRVDGKRSGRPTVAGRRRVEPQAIPHARRRQLDSRIGVLHAAAFHPGREAHLFCTVRSAAVTRTPLPSRSWSRPWLAAPIAKDSQAAPRQLRLTNPAIS
jgi:hypothetical protein